MPPRWIDEALARHERIMGFGHRVYKHGDPRAAILKTYCRELAREVGDDRWERIAEPIEQAVVARKQLPPNVDWPSARLYHYMGLRRRPLHADLRHGPGGRMGGPLHRADRPQSPDAAPGPLHRPDPSGCPAHRRAVNE